MDRTQEKKKPYVSKSRTSRHDGGLVDGHRVFSEIGYDGVTGFVVGRDGFVLFVDFNAPPLRTLCDCDVSDAKLLPASCRGGSVM